MTDFEEEMEQAIIDKEEKLEASEKCIEMIRDLLEVKCTTLEDYEGLVEEIEYHVKEYCNEFF